MKLLYMNNFCLMLLLGKSILAATEDNQHRPSLQAATNSDFSHIRHLKKGEKEKKDKEDKTTGKSRRKRRRQRLKGVLRADFSEASARNPTILVVQSMSKEENVTLRIKLRKNAKLYRRTLESETEDTLITNRFNGEPLILRASDSDADAALPNGSNIFEHSTPSDQKRHLRDLNVEMCPPPNSQQLDVTGKEGEETTVVLPGDVDSELIVCSRLDRMLGAYFHDVTAPSSGGLSSAGGTPADSVLDSEPTRMPTATPTLGPTMWPTMGPTDKPTMDPTGRPGAFSRPPTLPDTPQPSVKLTVEPSGQPTMNPTSATTANPTKSPPVPSARPTKMPSNAPSFRPTKMPSRSPSKAPTDIPTELPTGKPTPSPSTSTASGSGTDSLDPSKYNDLNWNQLPEAQQQAAATIGYSKQTWNRGDIILLLWSQLTDEQKVAAAVLEYNEFLWNADTYANADPDYWDNFFWSELPVEMLEAAKALGYNKNMWDEGIEADSSFLTWNELSVYQREAAKRFGYDKLSWDDEIILRIQQMN